MNYANVAYDLFPHNMASTTLTIDTNSKWGHCHPMYRPTPGFAPR